MLLAGFGFALAYGPLNIAATNGIAPRRAGAGERTGQHVVPVRRRTRARRLDGRDNANTGADGSQQALLDGFQAAVVVSVIAASIGVLVTAVRWRSKTATAVEPLPTAHEAEPEAEAA